MEKLRVLARIGTAFGEVGITWAVGGSLLLYCAGVVEDFSDLDLMVTEEDCPRAAAILAELGERRESAASSQFKTHCFLEYRVAGVEVDLMAGMVIVRDGVAYDCPLLPQDCMGRREVFGVSIPLHDLDLWRHYYQLMGRAGRVLEIDRFLKDSKIY